MARIPAAVRDRPVSLAPTFNTPEMVGPESGAYVEAATVVLNPPRLVRAVDAEATSLRLFVVFRGVYPNTA
jgi:hypothetical protein